MEKNIFDAIGIFLLILDGLYMLYNVYSYLYTPDTYTKTKYEKRIFISVVVVFAIVSMMALLQTIFY